MPKNKPTITDTLNWLSDPQPGHLVQFYQNDSDLLLLLNEFIGTGLDRGDPCLVIATPSHLKSLNDYLDSVDMLTNSIRRQYIALDATETLGKFMRHSMPDRNRFFDVLGPVIQKFATQGSPVRAYGEMVALLWKVGNKEAVIQLENLWNELAEIYSFSLLCAYPKLHFLWNNDMQQEIRECHNITLPMFVSA